MHCYRAIGFHCFVVIVSVVEVCWTEFSDTHSLNGQPDPATSLEACQNACLYNESCDGVDWNTEKETGQQCYLIGPWTTTRQNYRSGIDQYLLNRTCGKLAYNNNTKENCSTCIIRLMDSYFIIQESYSTFIVCLIVC